MFLHLGRRPRFSLSAAVAAFALVVAGCGVSEYKQSYEASKQKFQARKERLASFDELLGASTALGETGLSARLPKNMQPSVRQGLPPIPYRSYRFDTTLDGALLAGPEGDEIEYAYALHVRAGDVPEEGIAKIADDLKAAGQGVSGEFEEISLESPDGVDSAWRRMIVEGAKDNLNQRLSNGRTVAPTADADMFLYVGEVNGKYVVLLWSGPKAVADQLRLQDLSEMSVSTVSG